MSEQNEHWQELTDLTENIVKAIAEFVESYPLQKGCYMVPKSAVEKLRTRVRAQAGLYFLKRGL